MSADAVFQTKLLPINRATESTPPVDSEIKAEENITSDTEAVKPNILPGNPGDIQISYQLQPHSYQDKDNRTVLLYTEYQRPTVTIIGNEAASSEIAATFSKEEENFSSFTSNMINEAEDFFSEEPETFSSYYVDCRYETKRCDSSIISLQCCASVFSGGAHSNYTYRGLNFDTATGSLLTLSDITTDKDTMLKEAEDYIRTQLELPRYQKVLPDSQEDITSAIKEQILTDETWYFTNGGISFVSNTDVLAPHAAGPLFFTVPYQQFGTLKPEYQYTGPLELSAPVGSTISANLDGNEDMDAIFYDCVDNEETGELSCTFTINGTDFSSYLFNDDCYLSPGADGFNMEYYVVDLDTSDEFSEIAILDRGMSSDYMTYFFRYDRGNFIYLGSISDLLGNSSCKINGDGTLMADLPISLLETANTSVIYKLENNSLDLVEQNWYYINTEDFPKEYQSHDILKDVTVYREKSRHSDSVTLTPEDGPVSFPATDNEHWFMLKTSDDQLYYLYLEDCCTLESGEYATDIFQNLHQAG